LTARYALLAADREKLQALLEKQGSDLAALQQELDHLRGERDSLQAERDRLAAERAQFPSRDDVSRLEGLLRQAQERAEAVGHANAELEEQNRTLQARLNELSTAPSPATEDSAELRRQFEQERTDLARQMDMLRRELATCRQTLYTLGIEV
jgi:chromosome segregation ATPase